MNHIGMVTGLAVAFWYLAHPSIIALTHIPRVGYGVSHWTTKEGIYYGWRLSVAVQFIPAVIFMLGLPFAPETYVPPILTATKY